jgi:hypothetical protein
MNVEIWAEAMLFPEKEYINGIAVAVWKFIIYFIFYFCNCFGHKVYNLCNLLVHILYKIDLAGFKDVTKIVALPDKPSVIALIDVEKERTIVADNCSLQIEKINFFWTVSRPLIYICM